jgi:hypothetical protein
MSQLSLSYFFEKGTIVYNPIPIGYMVFYYRKEIGKRFVGYLLRDANGKYCFVKEIDLKDFRGKGQYYVYYLTAGTAKEVINDIENKFKDSLKCYAVKFVENGKPLVMVIYDWIYFKSKRIVKQEEGYEPQYQIELPADIEFLIDLARERGRVAVVEYDILGNREDRWYP